MDPIQEQLKEANPNPYGSSSLRSMKPQFFSGFERVHAVKTGRIEEIKPRKKNNCNPSLTLSVPIEIADCKNIKARDAVRLTIQKPKP
jgi:hypothetical protein